jgi:thiopeptide-type bacteriocin biosynthesis protein
MTGLPATDWLYYRLYAATPADLQALLERVVAPLVDASTRVPGAGRWFFLRFLDGQGHHVRLRWHGDLAAVAEIERMADRALFEAYGPGRDRWMAGPGRPVPPPQKALYQPEYRKFGGRPGVELAHTVFAASSTAVMASFSPAYWPRRVGYAAVHLARAVDVLPPDQVTAFLHQYEWYWCGQGRHPQYTARVRSVATRIRPELAAVVRDLLADPSATGPLLSYVDALRAALASRDRERIGRSDAHLLFDHLHLTDNRLGVTPMEEAMLAYLLRTTQLRLLASVPADQAVPVSSRRLDLRSAQSKQDGQAVSSGRLDLRSAQSKQDGQV